MLVGPILYVPGEQFPELEPHIGSYLNVIVLSKHLTTDNEQVCYSYMENLFCIN